MISLVIRIIRSPLSRTSPLKPQNVRLMSSTVISDFDSVFTHGLHDSSEHKVYSQDDTSESGQEDSKVTLPKTQQEYRYKVTSVFDQPKDPKFLQVSVIGMPNAGKSTLVNQLVGTKISAVSKKVHTTRRNVLGIKVEGSTQLVFSDSPGLVTTQHCVKHGLEHTFVSGPERSARYSDVIMVVVDASNPRERKKLSPGIIDKLTKYSDKESFLVLNKVDLMKRKRLLFDVSARLTDGVVDGVAIEQDTRKVIMSSDQELIAEQAAKTEARLRRKGYVLDLPKEVKESPVTLEGDSDENQEIEEDMNEPEELQGWSKFSRVFMVSALSGDGVEDIKNHLLTRAYPGKWKFPPDVVTPQDPASLVTLTVREKLMDNLPHEVPYFIRQRIQTWDVNRTGTLCVCMDLIATKHAHMSLVLGPQGKTISKIASEARQELSNAFKCDVSLKLIAKCSQRRRKV